MTDIKSQESKDRNSGVPGQEVRREGSRQKKEEGGKEHESFPFFFSCGWVNVYFILYFIVHHQRKSRKKFKVGTWRQELIMEECCLLACDLNPQE